MFAHPQLHPQPPCVSLWLARYRFIYLTNSTNSRVRSTRLLHTKSPFSRFFGCRRQKNKNIVVSARGRRTSQAPTLRVWGCVNARKYHYKSSSLYSQSTCTPRFSFLKNAAAPLYHEQQQEERQKDIKTALHRALHDGRPVFWC